MNKIELGAKIAAIITAMIAVGVFAIGIVDDQEDRRQSRIDSWRKAEIQRIFHDDNNATLKFSELASKLKSSAVDEEYIDIQRTDLTDTKIRILLNQLIASRILRQVESNNFALNFSTDTRVDLDSMSNLREIQYLGEVTCDREFTFSVPETGTTTQDWHVFGLNPSINTQFVHDSPNNNSITGFRTTVNSVDRDTAWKVNLEVQVNFATGAKKQNIGNCNKYQSGGELEGELSKIHVVAIRK